MNENEVSLPSPYNFHIPILGSDIGISSIVLSNIEAVDVPLELGEEVTIKFKVVEIVRTERL